MAADTETSHLEKDRKKTPKKENLHIFTSTVSWIIQMLGGFVIVFKEIAFAPFLSILKLVVSFFNNFLRDENRYS